MTRSSDPARSPSPLAGLLVTGSLLVLGVLCIALRLPMAEALVHGISAAEWHPPAGYPPFAAILFTPAAWLPSGVLKLVLLLGNAALLALLILLSCRLAGLRGRTGPVLAATIGGLWLEPLFQSPLSGQINLALACLAVWDLGRARGALGKGFALGTAAGITLTPAVFIPYLLLTGRIRAGLTALAGFTGTALLGLLVLPQASADFWARHLPGTGSEMLLHWPHLWVWTVPLLAGVSGALLRRRARTEHRAAPRAAPGPNSAPPLDSAPAPVLASDSAPVSDSAPALGSAPALASDLAPDLGFAPAPEPALASDSVPVLDPASRCATDTAPGDGVPVGSR
ncbi:glycosyltransferase 87 family protein [Streptomyces sp. NPDC017949]|uniref:glycosyltransferase family 87 protein n=1 Tax=Streptomyces sp. NPDC017949 TaxID=3365020 RepID=UPI00379473B5